VNAPPTPKFHDPVLEDRRIGPPNGLRVLAGIAAVGFAITFVGGVMFTVGLGKPVAAAFVVTGLALSFAMGLGAALEQRRRQKLLELADELEKLGYRVAFRFGRRVRPELVELSEPFANLAVLRGGAKSTAWAAIRLADERTGSLSNALLSHVHVQSDGRTTQVFKHVGAGVEAAPNWPRLRVTTENLGDKLARMLGRHTIRLDVPEFNDRFRVACKDEDFAVLLLSPAIQRWLTQTADRVESWHVANGWLICLRRGAGKLENALELADRAAEFRSMIDPPVFEYAKE